MLLHEAEAWQIYVHHVGSLQTNCYFLVHSPTQQALIIDPGDDGDFLSEEILRLDIKPVAIFLTHGHFDHVGAVLTLKLNFDLPVYLAAADEQLYLASRQSSQFWQKAASSHDPLPPVDFYLDEKTQLPEPFEDWRIMITPGHTPGSLFLHHPEEKIAFSGDTLFLQDIGRTDFKYSSPSDMKLSLEKIFATLSEETVVLPGHADPTSIDLEAPNLPHFLEQLGS